MKREKIILETTTDPVVKEFFRKPERFADLINASFFKGRQVVKATQLMRYDSESSTYFDLNKVVKSVSRYRDVIMQRQGKNPILIGLENQSTIDYTMPFRILIYDAITYNQQYNALPKEKQSSFKPVPIVTFVLYHGEDKWKQPFWLKQMMKIPGYFSRLINNWGCIVIDIKDINIKYLKNKENYHVIKAVQEFYEWNKDPKSIDGEYTREEAIVIFTMLKMEELKIEITKERKRKIDMCSKLREFAEENKQLGIKEGEARGKIVGIKEGEINGQIITIMMILQSKFGKVSIDLNEKIQKSSKNQLDLLTKNILHLENENDIMNLLV